MQRETMRKRGWSVHSEHTTGDTTVGSDDRSLSQEEKRLLLDSLPAGAVANDDDDDDDDFSTDDLAMESPNPVARKRRKLGNASKDMTTFAHVETHDPAHDKWDKDQMLELAKSKLSKWAARLFDPDRPRGLVEPLQIIPLNDEFLTAFGKREKEFDSEVGRSIEIDADLLLDDDDDESNHENIYEDSDDPSNERKRKLDTEGCKVKIANLGYTTKQETLEKACRTFGPLVEVNLIMDKEKSDMNIGRAYVTFETAEAADECLKKLLKLDGRSLRNAMALPDSKRTSRKSVGGGIGMARYWEKDISTKCFRCSRIGHMSKDCPNEPKPKPCPLCAGFGHEMWSCPMSRICFNCGVHGHMSRDCKQRRGLPKRMVCGKCFSSGHHRVNCRQSHFDVETRDAICMVCSKMGHFMCKDMKWFFGLEGVSCFNCGKVGHHGYDCERPGLDVCARDEWVTNNEIEMAGAASVVDELNQALGGNCDTNGRGRGRDRDNRDSNMNRNRAKSQPPPRSNNSNNTGRDHNRGYGDRREGRHTPPPQRGGDNRQGGNNVQNYSNNSHSGGKASQGQRGYSTGSSHIRFDRDKTEQKGRRGYR